MERRMELASFPGHQPLRFLVVYMTYEPPSDKLAEGLVPLLRHLQARWTVNVNNSFVYHAGLLVK